MGRDEHALAEVLRKLGVGGSLAASHACNTFVRTVGVLLQLLQGQVLGTKHDTATGCWTYHTRRNVVADLMQSRQGHANEAGIGRQWPCIHSGRRGKGEDDASQKRRERETGLHVGG